MVKIATTAAAGALVLAASAAAQATVNTPPSITQCQPAALQWASATGTVRLAVLPAGEVSAAPIAQLPDQTGASGSFVWTVNIPSGTNITITINDGSGVANYASPLVVLPSSDSSCLNAAASGSSSTAAGGAVSSTSTSSPSAASATSRDSSAAPSVSSPASSASSSTSSTGSPAQTSAAPNAAAAAFSPSTAGLSVLAIAGAILPFL